MASSLTGGRQAALLWPAGAAARQGAAQSEAQCSLCLVAPRACGPRGNEGSASQQPFAPLTLSYSLLGPADASQPGQAGEVQHCMGLLQEGEVTSSRGSEGGSLRWAAHRALATPAGAALTMPRSSNANPASSSVGEAGPLRGMCPSTHMGCLCGERVQTWSCMQCVCICAYV